MHTAPASSLGFPILAALLVGCVPDYEVIPEPVDVDPGDVTECDFTPISGTRMSEYDCNPVFTSTGESWGTQVASVGFQSTLVAGHPFYQMWYAASPEGQTTGYSLGYAISGDGTNWDAHPGNPLFSSQDGVWDQDIMDAIQVIWDEDTHQYVMIYQGATRPTSALDPGMWGMGVATSPDGLTWTKHANNPVIDFNGTDLGNLFDLSRPCWPLTLTRSTSGYTGYIAVSDGDLFSMLEQRCDIYSAAAPSLSTWDIGDEPILTGGDDYDTMGAVGASIVELDGIQYMFYVGFERWEEEGNGVMSSRDHNLALATSTDGVTWTKHPNNPFPIHQTSEKAISAVGAQVVGQRIHLWVTDEYEGAGQAVGYFLYEPDIDPHP